MSTTTLDTAPSADDRITPRAAAGLLALHVDGSVLTTGGVVNPTPTISALALRAAGYIRDNFGRLTGTSRSMAA